MCGYDGFLSGQASHSLFVGLTVVWFREHGSYNNFSGGAEDCGDQSNTLVRATSGGREGVQRIRRSLLHPLVGL